MKKVLDVCLAPLIVAYCVILIILRLALVGVVLLTKLLFEVVAQLFLFVVIFGVPMTLVGLLVFVIFKGLFG